MKADTIVLGAGMVGVATAIHLQKRGRAVALVDRGGAGQGTSFGNAGLIQREAVFPTAFPRDFKMLFDVATKRGFKVNYHARALPGLMPFLYRYWRNSQPDRYEGIARSYATLIEHCVTETRALAQEGGQDLLLRPSGWTEVFRTAHSQDETLAAVDRAARLFGIEAVTLDAAGLREAEPHLDTGLIGGVHFTQPDAVSDPGGLVDGLRRHFEALGGRFLNGDAASFAPAPGGWQVTTAEGPVDAATAVVALGPWADVVTERLGYRLMLAVKRGYHRHYRPQGNAVLHSPVLDVESGYILAPMARGIRLCTGVEFADRDAPKTPVQLARAEPVARALFPLAETVDAEPWMGRRPATPDMLPVIGPAPRHPGLWFAFGHAHQGLTLGALTGRLVAEMMTGVAPLVDMAPFRADRASLQR